MEQFGAFKLYYSKVFIHLNIMLFDLLVGRYELINTLVAYYRPQYHCNKQACYNIVHVSLQLHKEK